jgi:mitogen-activated protein kinase organizer 1
LFCISVDGRTIENDQFMMNVLCIVSELVTTMNGHIGSVLSLRFNRPGEYILSCGRDRRVCLWNLHTQLCIKTYAGHGYEVRDVAISDDSTKFVSVGADTQVFLWDISTGKIIRKFPGHDYPINCVQWVMEDKLIASGGEDKAIKLWDCRVKKAQPLQVLKNFTDSVSDLKVVGWRKELVAGSTDGTLKRFEIQTGAVFTDQLAQPLTSIALSHDGNYILAACLDSTLRLLGRERGDLLKSYQGHKNVTMKVDCCLTFDGAHVMCGSEDGNLYIWNLINETITLKIDIGTVATMALAMHPDNHYLVTGGADGAIKVWGSHD